MKTKKNTSIYIIISVVFILLYLFFAAKPLAKEYHYNPVWKISTVNPVEKKSDITANNHDLLYFKLGNSAGYFNEDGDIFLSKTYPFQAAISDYYYSLYNSQASDISIYNNKGIECGKLEAAGFPYYDEDRIYVFMPGGASFAKSAENGKTLWTSENTMPITAFNSTQNYTACGFADGIIKIYENESGNNTLTYAPGGSDIPVILGLDVSENGQLIASVSGHDQQRFVLAKKEESQTKILFHKFLETDTNYRTLVHICEDQNRVFYSYKDYLGIYDCLKDKNYRIPISGQIISCKENDNLIFLLGYEKDLKKYTVYIVEKTNSLEGAFSFEADNAFIHVRNNSLYVGRNNTISKINISKE